MKSKLFLLFIILSLAASSCTKEEDPVFTPQSARIGNMADRVADDISVLAEEEFLRQRAELGRNVFTADRLPECASVTTTVAGGMWTTSIDFGQNGCKLTSGTAVSGTVILIGSTDFTTASYSVSYSFHDFYHDGRKVEGSRDITFSWQSTPAQSETHLVADIDLDLSITLSGGRKFQRDGHRVRETIDGYQTPLDRTDDVYQISGAWTTEFPNGVLAASVGTPLIWHATCPHIGAGTLNFSIKNTVATLDYGNGLCDYFAMLEINGEAPESILLN